MDAFITCHSCHAIVWLDSGPAAQLAEMATFCAAHSRHPDPAGFELLLQLPPAVPATTAS